MDEQEPGDAGAQQAEPEQGLERRDDSQPACLGNGVAEPGQCCPHGGGGYEVTLLRREEAEGETGLLAREPHVAERVYAELSSRLIAVERDLVSFPITYYFVESDPRFSLAATAPYLLELAERGGREDVLDRVRLRARLLQALEDLAATTARGFQGARGDAVVDLLHGYARDHLRER